MSKHVLITGATRGIGFACAGFFARRGWRITAVARSVEPLRQLQANFPNTPIQIIAADLATDAGVAAIPSHTYNAVVLNAATFAPGALLTGEKDVFSELWALNGRGNYLLARRVLPAMIKAKQGHLLVVGSLGTDYWPAHLTAYIATKYALRGLFLGWQEELAHTGVLTTLVAPGATLTSSWDTEVPPPNILAPEEVAAIIYDAIQHKRTGRIEVHPNTD